MLSEFYTAPDEYEMEPGDPEAWIRPARRSPRWIDLLTQSHYNHRGLWVIHLFQIHTPLLPLPLMGESGTPQGVERYERFPERASMVLSNSQ